QSSKEPDAVVAMHHGVAELQVAQIGEKGFGRTRTGDAGPLLLPEDFFLGIDGETWLAQPKSGGNLCGERDDRRLPDNGGERQTVLGSEPSELLASSRRLASDEDLLSGLERPG